MDSSLRVVNGQLALLQNRRKPAEPLGRIRLRAYALGGGKSAQ